VGFEHPSMPLPLAIKSGQVFGRKVQVENMNWLKALNFRKKL
jgi:hypothetical protein